jgi:hypothetical protein
MVLVMVIKAQMELESVQILRKSERKDQALVMEESMKFHLWQMMETVEHV